MAVTNTWRIHAMEIGATAVDIIDSTHNLGITLDSTMSGSSVRRQSVWITEHNPRITVRTRAAASVLDLLATSTELLAKDVGALTGGVDIFFAKKAMAGGIASGSVHRKITINDGAIMARAISADGTGHVIVDIEIIPTYDGSNDLVIESDSNALPTGISDTEAFALGPLTLESEALAQLTSLRIDTGLTTRVERDGSDLYPTFVHITQVAPKITASGTDIQWIKSDVIPRAGLAITRANTEIGLRKRISGGGFEGDAELEHITFTANGLVVGDQVTLNPESGTIDIMAELYEDGSGNAPLSYASSQALS